jgi:ketosteroid isomerase-like protein
MKTVSSVGAVLLGIVLSWQAMAEMSPQAALDTLHQAGVDADPEAFTAVLAPDAVFLGVADSARLQGQALRDFIDDSFSSGNAWDYRISARDVQLSADGSVAWFDESLESDELGSAYGSGVLTQSGGVWRVVQYSLVASPEARSVAAPVVPVTPQEPQQPECRKLRHKTNKKATC